MDRVSSSNVWNVVVKERDAYNKSKLSSLISEEHGISKERYSEELWISPRFNDVYNIISAAQSVQHILIANNENALSIIRLKQIYSAYETIKEIRRQNIPLVFPTSIETLYRAVDPELTPDTHFERDLYLYISSPAKYREQSVILAHFRKLIEMSRENLNRRIRENRSKRMREAMVKAVKFSSALYGLNQAVRVVVVDLGFRIDSPEHLFSWSRPEQDISYADAHGFYQAWYNAVRKSRLFKSCLGLMWRPDYSIEKGYHFTVVWFFKYNARHPSDDVVERIEESWLKRFCDKRGVVYDISSDVGGYKKNLINSINTAEQLDSFRQALKLFLSVPLLVEVNPCGNLKKFGLVSKL